MKLIYCEKCHDIFALRRERRSCICGQSSGWYESDGLMSTIQGAAVPLGFANNSFLSALRCRPHGRCDGSKFTAFVIPWGCETVKLLKDGKEDGE